MTAQALSPKQQEIRERSGRILDIARRILATEGLNALTMNRLAKEIGRTKPTVYEHFIAKEDVLMGLAIEDAIQRWALYEQAATFPGRSRERLMALGVFGARVYPDHLRIYETLQPAEIRQRASQSHQALLFENEWRAHRLMSAVVRDGISEGDLVLPQGMAAENVAYSIYCISLGGYLSEIRGVPEDGVGITNTLATLQWAQIAFLDGIGWRPLSTDWDYRDTVVRIREALNVDQLIAQSEILKRQLRQEQEEILQSIVDA